MNYNSAYINQSIEALEALSTKIVESIVSFSAKIHQNTNFYEVIYDYFAKSLWTRATINIIRKANNWPWMTWLILYIDRDWLEINLDREWMIELKWIMLNGLNWNGSWIIDKLRRDEMDKMIELKCMNSLKWLNKVDRAQMIGLKWMNRLNQRNRWSDMDEMIGQNEWIN